MRKTKAYLFLFFISFSVFGQNAKEDFRKINDLFSNHRVIAMGITYNVFANYNAETPIETSAGSYFQNGEDRYNRLNEIESIQNKECSIVIDNEEKIIVIGNPVKFEPGKMAMANLDTAISKYASIKYFEVSPVQKGYSLFYKSSVRSDHDRVDVFFNAKTFVLEKMVYYYRNKEQLVKTNQDAAEEKPRLEVSFSNIKFELNADEKFYTESRFVSKKNGKYLPVNAYSSYKVSNQKFVQ